MLKPVSLPEPADKMAVIADTSPINYLVQIGQIEILNLLYKAVLIPSSVAAELAHEESPPGVRTWIASPPRWLVLHAPPVILPAVSGLDKGESEAISLAVALQVPLILIDERRGRAVAEALRLQVIGTLRVLLSAAAANLLNLDDALLALQSTSFHLSESLLEQFIERSTKRWKGKP